MNEKVTAMVKSKNDFDTVTIIEHIDNNNVKALYGGNVCTAIFNPFTGIYYVDDVYGRVKAYV